MRISDWSSDVCSSDLAFAIRDVQLDEVGPCLGRGVEDREGASGDLLGELGRRTADELVRDLLGLGVATAHLEIGRGACRERVGQYVSISGVTVALNKKK